MRLELLYEVTNPKELYVMANRELAICKLHTYKVACPIHWSDKSFDVKHIDHMGRTVHTYITWPDTKTWYARYAGVELSKIEFHGYVNIRSDAFIYLSTRLRGCSRYEPQTK